MEINNKKRAFTLVELVVVIAIMGIVLTTAYQAFGANRDIFPKATTRSFLQQDVRLSSEYITKEIRYARYIVMYTTIPVSFSPDLVYIFSENNNVKYIKNGVTKNLLGDDPKRTLHLLFSYKDINTVSFSVEGQARTLYNLETDVELLNIDKNIQNNDYIGTNGVCIAYSLNDFVNHSPVVVHNSPFSIDSYYNITPYPDTSETSPVSSFYVTGALTPFSVEPFFTDVDISSGDKLTYYASSSDMTKLYAKVDNDKKLNLYVTNSISGDTPIWITLKAEDRYGGTATTNFSVTVKDGAAVSPGTATFNGSGDTIVFYQNTGTRSIDISSYFNYTGSPPIYKATYGGTPFDLNTISTTDVGSKTIDLNAIVNYGTADEDTVSGTISIKVVPITLKVYYNGIETSDESISIKKNTDFTLKFTAIADGKIVRVFCSPENSFSDCGFSGTYDKNSNTYSLSADTDGKVIQIRASVYGYNSGTENGFLFKTITITGTKK